MIRTFHPIPLHFLNESHLNDKAYIKKNLVVHLMIFLWYRYLKILKIVSSLSKVTRGRFASNIASIFNSQGR